MASIYLLKGDYKEAKLYISDDKILQNFIELNEFRKIKILITRKKYHKAIEESLKFYKKYPNNHLVKEKLSELYMAVGDYEKAKEFISLDFFYKKKEEDDEMTKKQNIINNLKSRGKYNEALKLFEELINKYEIRESKFTLIELCELAGKKEKIFNYISKKDYDEIKNSKKLYKYSHFK